MDHSIGGGHLLFRHSLRVRVRTDFAFFLISESDEYVGMLTRLIFYRLVEGRQKRRAAPVVDDSIAFGDVIEMRTNDDDLAGTARQNANTFGSFDPFTDCSERCCSSQPASENNCLSVLARCRSFPWYCSRRLAMTARETGS